MANETTVTPTGTTTTVQTVTATPEPIETLIDPQEQQSFDRDYVVKLREEAKANRLKAKELEEQLAEKAKEAERAKLEETDRLKAEIADRDEILEKLKEQMQEINIKAELVGQAVDADAAAKLVTADMIKDGKVDADMFFNKYPFMRAGPRTTAVGQANAASEKSGNLKPEDFRGKSPDWVRKNIDRLKR